MRITKRSILRGSVALTFIAVIAGIYSHYNQEIQTKPRSPFSTLPAAFLQDVDEEGLSQSIITLQTQKGIIKFKLYAKDAPQSARQIASLVYKGFYDGLHFHRAVPNFVIQTGDREGDGRGGSGHRLPFESNNRKHEEGVVGLARDPEDPPSADSQFYITLASQFHLDKQFTVIGKVVEGLDVAKSIERDDKIIKATIELPSVNPDVNEN